MLEAAGLLASERTGRRRTWRLRPQRLAALGAELDRLSALWDERLARLRSMVEVDEG